MDSRPKRGRDESVVKQVLEARVSKRKIIEEDTGELKCPTYYRTGERQFVQVDEDQNGETAGSSQIPEKVIPNACRSENTAACAAATAASFSTALLDSPAAASNS